MQLTAEDSESGDFEIVNENEFQQLKNKVTKLGYADGVADGRESVFQKGFDQGYKDGLRTSFEIEKYRNFFINLSADENERKQDLLDEKEEFTKVYLPEATSAEHFQYVHHKSENLNIISSSQHKYVDSIIESLEQKLPQASNLLKSQLNRNGI